LNILENTHNTAFGSYIKLSDVCVCAQLAFNYIKAWTLTYIFTLRQF